MSQDITKKNGGAGDIKVEKPDKPEKPEKTSLSSSLMGPGGEKPTEEQVEKLEEKLESAQGDQKNLFLIIFQVGLFSTFGSLINNVSRTR